MMFTRSQFLSCSGFLGFLKVIKGDWQEMLPGTWSVLIDGSGSVVLSQAAGRRPRVTALQHRDAGPAGTICFPVPWAGARQREKGAVLPAPQPSPRSPIFRACFQIRSVMVQGWRAQQRGSEQA